MTAGLRHPVSSLPSGSLHGWEDGQQLEREGQTQRLWGYDRCPKRMMLTLPIPSVTRLLQPQTLTDIRELRFLFCTTKEISISISFMFRSQVGIFLLLSPKHHWVSLQSWIGVCLRKPGSLEAFAHLESLVHQGNLIHHFQSNYLKGRVTLLAKITLPIKFAILINNTLMKNSKKISNFFKLQICEFLLSDFQPILVTTGTDRQPSLVSTATDCQAKVVAMATDHQPKVVTTATDFQPILMHYVHFVVSALNSL